MLESLFRRKNFFLAGAVTGLENGNSMELYGFLYPFRKDLFNEPKSLGFFIVHGNLKHFLYFGRSQCDYGLFHSHEYPPRFLKKRWGKIPVNKSLYFNITGLRNMGQSGMGKSQIRASGILKGCPACLGHKYSSWISENHMKEGGNHLIAPG